MPITQMTGLPQRTMDQDTFDSAVAELMAKWPAFITEANALELAAAASAVAAAASAVAAAASEAAAAQSEDIALAAANFKGTYASRVGAAAVPYSVSHLGSYWMLLSNLADVTAKVPGTDAEWQEIGGVPGYILQQQGVI